MYVETGIERVRLGRTDLLVSPIAFGTWQLGGEWGPTDESAAITAIRHAVDEGINLFDTADAHHGWDREGNGAGQFEAFAQDGGEAR